MILSLILLSLTVASFNVEATDEKVIVCYYGTWATYRHGLGKFDVEHIDPFLCTHLIYTFVGINDQGTVISLDPFLDLADNWGRNNFRKFNDLKNVNPKLKTLLAVGGWNEGSARYSVMAADPVRRKNFVTSALNMIKTHGFDGFDVDWEYPNQRDTVHGKADIDNFTQVLKELKEAFEPYGLLVTAAVAATAKSASQSYDIPAISKYLDFINIMAYDLHGAWDPETGHNAALHKSQQDETRFSVDFAVKFWLDEGCPPEKLVLGVPFYGRSFALRDVKQNGVRAPANGAGIAGPFTATAGFVGYNEFCTRLSSESWDVRFDDLGRVPFAVRDNNWVSYDNPESLVEKVDFGLKFNIAGFMVWSIETDDFHGQCHQESFPLLKALNRAAKKPIPQPPTDVEHPTTTTTTTVKPPTTTTTTVKPPATTTIKAPTPTIAPPDLPTTFAPTRPLSICTKAGFEPNPEDCSSFYVCVDLGDGSYQAHKFHCSKNLFWDQQHLFCNYANLVKCDL